MISLYKAVILLLFDMYYWIIKSEPKIFRILVTWSSRLKDEFHHNGTK